MASEAAEKWYQEAFGVTRVGKYDDWLKEGFDAGYAQGKAELDEAVARAVLAESEACFEECGLDETFYEIQSRVKEHKLTVERLTSNHEKTKESE